MCLHGPWKGIHLNAMQKEEIQISQKQATLQRGGRLGGGGVGGGMPFNRSSTQLTHWIFLQVDNTNGIMTLCSSKEKQTSGQVTGWQYQWYHDTVF